MNYIRDYYLSTNENERLFKDKRHHVEFLTTIKYILKYLKTGDRILEVGAATGVYSRYLASLG